MINKKLTNKFDKFFSEYTVKQLDNFRNRLAISKEQASEFVDTRIEAGYSIEDSIKWLFEMFVVRPTPDAKVLGEKKGIAKLIAIVSKDLKPKKKEKAELSSEPTKKAVKTKKDESTKSKKNKTNSKKKNS